MQSKDIIYQKETSHWNPVYANGSKSPQSIAFGFCVVVGLLGAKIPPPIGGIAIEDCPIGAMGVIDCCPINAGLLGCIPPEVGCIGAMELVVGNNVGNPDDDDNEPPKVLPLDPTKPPMGVGLVLPLIIGCMMPVPVPSPRPDPYVGR